MRTGYVVSGVLFVSLATVFGFVALILGVFYGIANAGGTFCGTPGTITATQLAICNAFTTATVVTAVCALAFYIVGTLFLWTGFRVQTPAHTISAIQPAVPLCPNCKAQLNPGQKFCHNCGAKLA